MIDFKKTMTKDNLGLFAEYVKDLDRKIGFKVSARGWCYLLETERIINKDQFDKVEGWINRCRRVGLLPIDFIAEEASRSFSGVDKVTIETPLQHFAKWLVWSLDCSDMYGVNWWDGEDYYIQMIVEKIDLKTLFSPVCERYHIPIATSKGWSSMLQRAEYARRFKEAEDKGLQPILLYCGDHDPDGLRISDFMKSNLLDLADIEWEDGTAGYDPSSLLINRFGLNEDFIEEHELTWIDNLITGSKKNLASPRHKNFHQPYVQKYLRDYGARKCEANSLIPMPRVAREFVKDVIVGYLGDDALDRFDAKSEAVTKEIEEYQEETGIADAVQEIVEEIGRM